MSTLHHDIVHMGKTEIIADLEATRDQTLACFDLNEDALRKNYGAGKWNVRQILHHLSDSEHVFLERLKRIIAGPKQVIWVYDQETWNDAFNHKFEPLDYKRELFQAGRNLNIILVLRFYEKFGDREFVHSEDGVRRLADEFARIASHNASHIQQIQTALLK